MTHAEQFLSEAKQIIDGLNVEKIELMATILEQTRNACRPVVHTGGWRQCCQCVTRR